MTLRPVDDAPLLLRAEEAARLLGLGRSKVFEMLATGELPAVRIGRAVRVSRASLERWVRDQTGEPGSARTNTDLTAA